MSLSSLLPPVPPLPAIQQHLGLFLTIEAPAVISRISVCVTVSPAVYMPNPLIFGRCHGSGLLSIPMAADVFVSSSTCPRNKPPFWSECVFFYFSAVKFFGFLQSRRCMQFAFGPSGSGFCDGCKWFSIDAITLHRDPAKCLHRERVMLYSC